MNEIRRGSNGGYMFTTTPRDEPCQGFCAPVGGVILCPQCAATADAEAAQEADLARRERADDEIYGGGWTL